MLRYGLAACQRTLRSVRTEYLEDRALFGAAMDSASDLIVRLDANGHPVSVSSAVRTVLGCEPADLLLRADEDAGDADPTGLHRALATALPDSGGPATIWRARHRNGAPVWLEARCVSLAAGGGMLAVLRDITLQRQLAEKLAASEARLTRLSQQDSLTGLPNRTCFLETADGMMGGSSGAAIFVINLDRFKTVNDVHGHAVGDAILRTVAARLRQMLARPHAVARLGGDEFAALLRAEDGDPAIAAQARDMIRAISAPIEVGEMTLDVGATIGLAVSPRDGSDAAALMRAADIAMTHAKRAGGGSYRFFEDRMGEELALATDLKSELRAAIAAREVVPYFQPLVRLSDGGIVAFEILARWEHPRRGTLPPSRFLPLVEEAGLAPAMFASLLTQACVAARRWPEHVKLAVNISPHELQDESLPDDIADILERNGLDGRRLEIEITENALIHDSRIARGVLDRLRALGIAIALDDFGTGFSSLYHLRELPFDKVKIDKSFMRALDTDADSERYVAAIIGLGRALGLQMTAEGIEDQAVMQRLRDLGCAFGQGYLFGRPVSVEAATAMLAGSGVHTDAVSLSDSGLALPT